MSSLLNVQNVGKCYRVYGSEGRRFAGWFGIPLKPREENWVLRDASFELLSGQSLGVVGLNGAGKSTLLKIISGTLKQSEGNVQRNGRISAILELGMGFNPELTGRQNSVHNLGIMGFNSSEIRKIIPEIEDFSEIGEYFDQPVRTYSSGMQIRVAFAVATAFRPDILIVDEALAVGDLFFQAKCYHRISSFRKQGTSLILVTHSMDQIVKHCNRAIYIKNGGIKSEGSPAEISNMYTDDLFSEHKDNTVASINSEKPDEAEIFSKNAEDRFATHPGYRKEEYLWGDGGARIIDFLICVNEQIYPPVVRGNSVVEFSFKVIFDENFADVTPGIIIKTHDGIIVYGTNSFLVSEADHPIQAIKGSIKVFQFKSPIELNVGHYLVSFGISSGPQEKLKPLSRRYDSVLMVVDRPRPFLGIVDLRSEFEMTV